MDDAPHKVRVKVYSIATLLHYDLFFYHTVCLESLSSLKVSAVEEIIAEINPLGMIISLMPVYM